MMATSPTFKLREHANAWGVPWWGAGAWGALGRCLTLHAPGLGTGRVGVLGWLCPGAPGSSVLVPCPHVQGCPTRGAPATGTPGTGHTAPTSRTRYPPRAPRHCPCSTVAPCTRMHAWCVRVGGAYQGKVYVWCTPPGSAPLVPGTLAAPTLVACPSCCPGAPVGATGPSAAVVPTPAGAPTGAPIGGLVHPCSCHLSPHPRSDAL